VADRLGAAFHEAHDLELIARAAAGDLAASEAVAARDQIASCDVCAALAGDLRAIAAATREFGAAASRAAAPPAPRDFRLTETDAARLRRRGFLGLGRIVGANGGRARGLGGALAALGLVGLLVSAGMPSLFLGAGGAATSESVGGAATSESVGGAATSESVGGAAASESADGISKDRASMPAELAPAATDGYAVAATGEPARLTDAVAQDDDTPTVGGSVILAIGSIGFLVSGLVLLLASRTGRRSGL
jgi:hypothetical protein